MLCAMGVWTPRPRSSFAGRTGVFGVIRFATIAALGELRTPRSSFLALTTFRCESMLPPPFSGDLTYCEGLSRTSALRFSGVFSCSRSKRKVSSLAWRTTGTAGVLFTLLRNAFHFFSRAPKSACGLRGARVAARAALLRFEYPMVVVVGCARVREGAGSSSPSKRLPPLSALAFKRLHVVSSPAQLVLNRVFHTKGTALA